MKLARTALWLSKGTAIICFGPVYTARHCIHLVFVIGYGKRAHFAQELIFQNKQLKNVTPLDFVHNSDSLKCYNFSQEDQFFML